MIFANGKISDFEGSKAELLSNISMVIRDVHEQEALTEDEIKEAVRVGLLSEEEFHKEFKQNIRDLLKMLREHSEKCDECELKDECDETNGKAEKTAKEDVLELMRRLFGDIL